MLRRVLRRCVKLGRSMFTILPHGKELGNQHERSVPWRAESEPQYSEYWTSLPDICVM